MRAYGTDRVRTDSSGRILLSCRVPKPAWTARTPRTLTHAEHPGTAVLWDESCYEVVEVQPLQGNAVCYVLEPWRQELVMRFAERYDAESEASRIEERRAAAGRERKRAGATGLAVFTGHLPARVQEELASDLGIIAPRLTLVSAIPAMVPFVICLHLAVQARLAGTLAPTPGWVWLLATYLLFESIVRAGIAWTQNRPIGSAIGLLAYSIYYALARRRGAVSPFAAADGGGVGFAAPTGDQALRDAFTLREPLVTLLDARDQARILERFEYDYRTYSHKVAVVIVFACVAGVITSLYTLLEHPRPGAIVALLVAVALFVEQLFRIRAFERGPAGSMLAFLVRPFVRKLLT